MGDNDEPESAGESHGDVVVSGSGTFRQTGGSGFGELGAETTGADHHVNRRLGCGDVPVEKEKGKGTTP